MKDLWVNLVGAAVFSACGYLYVLRRDKYKFAGNFIITKELEEYPPEQTNSF